MKLIFATHNPHKLVEVKDLFQRTGLHQRWELLGLQDIGCGKDLPEPYDTLEENAAAKAGYIWTQYGLSCFADDTGLEVSALEGKPGVYSARYAGPGSTYEENVRKLIWDMDGKMNRKARFRTVISMFLEGRQLAFEGEVKGKILDYARGSNGFGYDPIFLPEGARHTFAEMSLEEKNGLSHRARAFDALVGYLNGLNADL